MLIAGERYLTHARTVRSQEQTSQIARRRSRRRTVIRGVVASDPLDFHLYANRMTRSGDQSREPVTVLESSDAALLAVAKSLLEGAGIEFFAKDEGVQDLFAWGRFGTGFNPFVGPVQVQVSAEDAKEARALLSDLIGDG